MKQIEFDNRMAQLETNYVLNRDLLEKKINAIREEKRRETDRYQHAIREYDSQISKLRDQIYDNKSEFLLQKDSLLKQYMNEIQISE